MGGCLDNKYYDYVPCNLCGADDYSVIYPAINTNRDPLAEFKASGHATNRDRVVKCNRCGLQYVNPRLKGDLIINSYSEGSDVLFVAQRKDREATFERCWRSIASYLPIKGRILDIGTAAGTFLKVAKGKGWEPHGVEPNAWMAELGNREYRLDIKVGTLEQQNYPTSFFDAVTLWDVLEHVPDPKALLKECNRILKPNGVIVVNYPDIGTWISRVMGKKWAFLLSVHLFYFTRSTMKQMLNVSGFTVIKFKPHFQSLPLGYLLYRMHQYSKFLSKVSSWLTNTLKMNNVRITYWLGQNLVIAKKQ